MSERVGVHDPSLSVHRLDPATFKICVQHFSGFLRHQHLKNKALRVRPIDRSTRAMLVHHLVEAVGQLVGGLSREGQMIVAEDGLERLREEKP